MEGGKERETEKTREGEEEREKQHVGRMCEIMAGCYGSGTNMP